MNRLRNIFNRYTVASLSTVIFVGVLVTLVGIRLFSLYAAQDITITNPLITDSKTKLVLSDNSTVVVKEAVGETGSTAGGVVSNAESPKDSKPSGTTVHSGSSGSSSTPSSVSPAPSAAPQSTAPGVGGTSVSTVLSVYGLTISATTDTGGVINLDATCMIKPSVIVEISGTGQIRISYLQKLSSLATYNEFAQSTYSVSGNVKETYNQPDYTRNVFFVPGTQYDFKARVYYGQGLSQYQETEITNKRMRC
ncbi:hypothetical protein KC949_00585 [Candidatus Saccharibacteria bacterium]|nr:hypothetical protein [Candidatus Saccharibacteria bacterium]